MRTTAVYFSELKLCENRNCILQAGNHRTYPYHGQADKCSSIRTMISFILCQSVRSSICQSACPSIGLSYSFVRLVSIGSVNATFKYAFALLSLRDPIFVNPQLALLQFILIFPLPLLLQIHVRDAYHACRTSSAGPQSLGRMHAELFGISKIQRKNMHEQNWECNLFIEMRHDILEMLLTIHSYGMDMHAYLQLAIMVGI